MAGVQSESDLLPNFYHGAHCKVAAARIDELEAEIERLSGWLSKIDGGDCPCCDEKQLRQWAYNAITLRHGAPQ